MSRKQNPEQVFLQHIKVLIRNLLINNKNYRNGYYATGFGGHDYIELLNDTKERAKYILDEIEKTEHLLEDKEIK